MVAHPTPQNRDRAYIVFWRKGARRPNLRFDVPCWCVRCERVVQGVQTWKNPRKPFGKLGDHKRNQYVYVCPDCARNPRIAKRAVDAIAYPYAYGAGSAIDWSIPAPRIGDRRRLGLPPLVPSTIRRIEHHLARLRASLTADPAIVPVSRSNDPDGRRARPITEPAFTQTARRDLGLAVPLPFIVNSDGTARYPWPVDRPAGTVTANGNHHYLTIPPGFLVANYGNGITPGKDGWIRPVGLPAGTVTTTDHHALLVPSGGTWNENARAVRDPAPTVTTTEAWALLEPQILSYYRTGQLHGVSRPVGVVETRERHALIDLIDSLVVDECGYRMCKVPEIRRFMAFPDDHKTEPGMSSKELVRGYGNAVTPPVMHLLVSRVLEALAA
jgi:DNA (cytosine-5)-methyltransferase 1